MMRTIRIGLAAALAVMGGVAGAQTIAQRKAECVGDLNNLSQHGNARATRVLVSFSGPEPSLMPLFEAIGGGSGIVNVVPINQDLFLLSIIGVPPKGDPAMIQIANEKICSLGLSKGAWFHGTAEYAGNEMLTAKFPARPGK